MENRHDGDTKVGENRHLMTTILTRAKSKRTAIATAAVLLAAFLALAWPHAMPTGNKDEGNSAATTQREAAGATEEENETSSGKPESGNPSAQETASHQHNWVVQTKTVHHDAQYRTVHHDAVVKYVSICNNCGADITGNEAAHIKNSLLNGGNCGSCHEESRTVQAAYDEQVQASAAWDETVTTGYKCSGCGATK